MRLGIASRLSLGLAESFPRLDVGNRVLALHGIRTRMGHYPDKIGGTGYQELFAQTHPGGGRDIMGAHVRSMLG